MQNSTVVSQIPHLVPPVSPVTAKAAAPAKPVSNDTEKAQAKSPIVKTKNPEPLVAE